MSVQHAVAAIRRVALVPPGAIDLVRTGPQLRKAEEALARVGSGGLTVWYGVPGTGKTCAAWLLCKVADERGASRAVYVDAPRPSGAVWDERKTLRAIIGELGTPLCDRAVRGQSSNHLVRHLATRLLAADVRVLVVDEAGYLGPSGIEAIGMLSDHLAGQAEPFHVVLAGMMDLPGLLRSSPRVQARVQAHEHFGGVSVETLGAVVARRHPWIESALDARTRMSDLIAQAHTLTGGCMREAVWIFEHLRNDCCSHGLLLNPRVLVHIAGVRAEARARLVREEVRQAATREALPQLMPKELRERFNNAGAWSD